MAEHHANVADGRPTNWSQSGEIAKMRSDRPHVDLLPELITPRSRILALGQMSNVTGGCPDLAPAITFAHSAGMVVMVDGAAGGSAFPRMFSNWILISMLFQVRMHGLRIGVLYGKSELLEAMSPWLGGGKMIHEVSFDGFTTQSAPWKLEAGTPNVAGVIG
ncbi:aminotransferase class V-fold PLP-dependent enzyme [Escherichia coli]